MVILEQVVRGDTNLTDVSLKMKKELRQMRDNAQCEWRRVFSDVTANFTRQGKPRSDISYEEAMALHWPD